jgi:acyl-CoA thioesterase FadM
MMHAARPYEYVEDAFLAWLDRECGGYESLRAGGNDFVIVQTQCRYIAPARLGGRIDLAVRPVGAGKRSSFTVEVEMAPAGRVLIRCSVTYVTVRDGHSSPIPGPLREALQANRLGANDTQ